MRCTDLILVLALAFASALPSLMQAQEQQAKRITFFGRVESIDFERKVLVVKHGKIAGYMDSGATEHRVDEAVVLDRLRPGDDIRAIVYPNDLTLYRIHVVYRSAGENTPKK